MSVVKVEGVPKRLGETTALQGIELEIAASEQGRGRRGASPGERAQPCAELGEDVA